eukprot:1465812-Pyramimonas_sp.AAC.1
MWSSPEGAYGRAMAVRIQRGPVDVTAIIIYFQTQPKRTAELPHYVATVKTLIEWYDHVLSELPYRSTPI